MPLMGLAIPDMGGAATSTIRDRRLTHSEKVSNIFCNLGGLELQHLHIDTDLK